MYPTLNGAQFLEKSIHIISYVYNKANNKISIWISNIFHTTMDDPHIKNPVPSVMQNEKNIRLEIQHHPQGRRGKGTVKN